MLVRKFKRWIVATVAVAALAVIPPCSETAAGDQARDLGSERTSAEPGSVSWSSMRWSNYYQQHYYTFTVSSSCARSRLCWVRVTRGGYTSRYARAISPGASDNVYIGRVESNDYVTVGVD
jgi:hypothetical protein